MHENGNQNHFFFLFYLHLMRTVKRNTKEFTNQSFIRGLKYDNCVIILWQQRMC